MENQVRKKLISRSWLIACQVFFFLVAVIIFIIICYKNLPLAKSQTYRQTFSSATSPITYLEPKGRALDVCKNEVDAEHSQRFISEPVYFTFRRPVLFKRAFLNYYDKLQLKIRYRNQGQPIIKIGAKKGATDFDYHYQTLEVQMLSELSWPKIEDPSGLTLWQKPIKKFETLEEDGNSEESQESTTEENQAVQIDFNSIEDFLATDHPAKKIGIFNYDYDPQSILPGYQAKQEVKEYNQVLRGNYTILTYINNETLKFTFNLKDINRHQGADPIQLQVLKYGKVITSSNLLDDGNTQANGVSREERQLAIEVTDLTPGIYTIKLDCSYDIFTTKITTSQNKWLFSDLLYLAGSEEYQQEIPGINTQAVNFYVSGNILRYKTSHESSFQNIKVAGQTQAVNIKDQYLETSIAGQTSVQLAKNDIIFRSTDGYFVFNQEDYFDPNLLTQVIPIQANTNLGQLDYVIGSYPQPETDLEGWRTSTVEFDLDDLYLAESNLGFIISVPGLSGRKGEVEIRLIEITLSK